MRSESSDIRKIGTWALLVGYVLLAVILPAGSPAAVVAEVLALIFLLELLFPVTRAMPQPVCAGYCSGVRPRSPPAY